MGHLERAYTNGHHEAGKTVTRTPEDGEQKAKALLESCISPAASDWTQLCEWRRIGAETVKEAATWGTLRQTLTSYCFFATQPPSVQPQRMVAAMSRNKPPEKKWMSYGAYPVWVPWWKPEANTVIVLEGQWDALCMAEWVRYLEDADSIQVLALCGPKNIEKYPEILEYFQGKKLMFIPDFDKPDKDGMVKGDEIIMNTYDAIEGVDCEKFLLRIPASVEAKDFNEWVQKDGITPEGFRDWVTVESEELLVKTSASLRLIADNAYCVAHGVNKKDGFFISDDGDPIKVYTEKYDTEEVWARDAVLKWIEPYPLLSEYVNECAACLESPILWHVMSMLTYTGAVIGRRLKFSSGANKALYPMLYTLLVGESGLGKSQSMAMLRRVAAQGTCADFFGSDNFSAESFYEELAKQSQRMFVFDEMSEWFPKSDNSYKLTASKALLKMEAADNYSDENPFRGSFRSKEDYEIKNPATSVLAGAIEHQMMGLPEDILKGGIVGRFMFVMAKRKNSSMAHTGGIGKNLADRIQQMFKGIYSTPFRSFVVCKFSDKAKIVFDMEYQAQERRNQSTMFSSQAMTYLARWKVRVMKMSMLFEILSGRHIIPLRPEDIAIRESSLMTAIRFEQVLTRCYLTLFHDSLASMEKTPASRLQKRVIDFFKEKSGPDGVSRNEILHFIQENCRVLDDCMAALIESNRIVQTKIKKPGRGRGKTVYYLVKDERHVGDPRSYELPKLLEKVAPVL